MKCSDYNST